MKPWQILTAIGVGAFFACLLICGGLAVAFVMLVQDELAAMQPYGPPANISYTLQGPVEAQVDQPFFLEAVVTNTDPQPQTLHSLENYSTLEIVSSDPAWTNRQGDLLLYGISLPPGQSQVIRLEVKAMTPGPDSVNIDANINDLTNYAEAWHPLDVKPTPTY